MATNQQYPKRDNIYTLREICEMLKLDDSPSLNFVCRGVDGVIQTSHVTEEQLLTVPGFAETKWRYVRTTIEWIPIFRYVDEKSIDQFVDLEEWRREEWEKDRPKYWWATPKGFPRQQFID